VRLLYGQRSGNLDTIAKKFQGCGVRLPKGFRKNYFRLSAITATVNHVTLHAQKTAVETFHMPRSLGFNDEELSDDEELDAPPCEIVFSQKPCRCNCYFLKKTRKILRLHPNQKYFFNYFKSLNSAISPPHAMIFSRKKYLLH